MPPSFKRKRAPAGNKINLQKLGLYNKSPVKAQPKPPARPASNPTTPTDPTSPDHDEQMVAPVAIAAPLTVSSPPGDFSAAVNLVLSQTWLPLPPSKQTTSAGASIVKFRQALPPAVLKSQLVGVYHQTPTMVDKELHAQVAQSRLRVVLVNGGLGGEVVVDSTSFFDVMQTTFTAPDNSSTEVFDAFKTLLESKPAATTLTEVDLDAAGLTSDGCRLIVNLGFLTLSTTASTAHAADTFDLALPNLGTLLRLVKLARKWVVDTLHHFKNGTMQEQALLQRWTNSKECWRKFRGLSVAWVLLDCYGGGWIERVDTPVGVHWKLTGKRL